MSTSKWNIDIGALFKAHRPTTPNKYHNWHLILIFTLAVVILGGAYTLFFVYQNIYNSLANAYNISIISTSLNNDNIDSAGFEKAKISIANLTQTSEPVANLRYLFEYNIVSVQQPPANSGTKSSSNLK